MAREKNQPIGEVECPRKGCDETASVFKYRSQAKTDSAKRFAGRLFCVCPGGHRCDDDQEYLLTKAKLWSPSGKEHASDASPRLTDASEKPAAKPGSTRATPPRTRQAKPPTNASAPKKPTTWGFW